MSSGERIIDLYIAFGQRRGNDTIHWMLLAVPRGEVRCTYYHVVGGPTQGREYRLEIQANKRSDSFGIASKEYVASIYEGDVKKLKSAAQRISLKRCQRWTCELLAELERKGMVPPGNQHLTTQESSRAVTNEINHLQISLDRITLLRKPTALTLQQQKALEEPIQQQQALGYGMHNMVATVILMAINRFFSSRNLVIKS